jgi:hypothetical protein
MTQIILVTGSRDLKKNPWYDVIGRAIYTNVTPVSVIIHGDCDGADRLAAITAKKQGHAVIPFPAKWTKYGRSAGPTRNAGMKHAVLPMLEYNNDVRCFAFHDNILTSKGTRHMAKIAWEGNIPVYLFGSDGECELHDPTVERENPFA